VFYGANDYWPVDWATLACRASFALIEDERLNALDLGCLASMTDELSSCDVDALSILDPKARKVQETPQQQSLRPLILTLDLHKKS
jgi:hypothetical protein